MNLEKYIEHTILKPDATAEELKTVCDEALKYNFFAVCVNPYNAKFVKEYLKGSDIKLVVCCGFPLGAGRTETKAFEAGLAVEDGADEIDMVLNITALKNKDYNAVINDVAQVKKACNAALLKVILETDFLSKDEIAKACELCVEAGADFVKTSTGFAKNGAGATAEDIGLMYKIVSPHGLRVKASGGIRDREKALLLIEKGASRLGTSSSVDIIEG